MSTSGIDTALLGMKLTIEQMEQTGRQIANMTEGDDLASNMIDLHSQYRTFQANAAVARTVDQTVGSIVDMFV